jgi:hypothetical protein
VGTVADNSLSFSFSFADAFTRRRHEQIERLDDDSEALS